jgi:hypothetical protein
VLLCVWAWQRRRRASASEKGVSVSKHPEYLLEHLHSCKTGHDKRGIYSRIQHPSDLSLSMLKKGSLQGFTILLLNVDFLM